MTEPVNGSDSPTGVNAVRPVRSPAARGPLQVDRARPRQRADLHGGTVGHVQAGPGVDLEQGVGEVHRGAERDHAAGDLERLEAEAELGVGDGRGIDDELAAAPPWRRPPWRMNWTPVGSVASPRMSVLSCWV